MIVERKQNCASIDFLKVYIDLLNYGISQDGIYFAATRSQVNKVTDFGF